MKLRSCPASAAPAPQAGRRSRRRLLPALRRARRGGDVWLLESRQLLRTAGAGVLHLAALHLRARAVPDHRRRLARVRPLRADRAGRRGLARRCRPRAAGTANAPAGSPARSWPCCGLFTFYESLILQASLDPFLTALELYTLDEGAAARLQRRGAPPRRAGTPFARGRGARLTRPQPAEHDGGRVALGIVALRAALEAARSKDARAAAFVLAARVVIAPAAIRN